MFPILHRYMHDFFDLILLNTIDEMSNMPGGVAFSDLQEFDNLPHSKVYRHLKKFEDKGLLEVKEEKNDDKLGRPRMLYYLSLMGKARLGILQNNMITFFQKLQETFPARGHNLVDIEKIVRSLTFNVLKGPPQFLNDQNLSNDEKLERLEKMEHHFRRNLHIILKHKKELLEKVKTQEERKK